MLIPVYNVHTMKTNLVGYNMCLSWAWFHIKHLFKKSDNTTDIALSVRYGCEDEVKYDVCDITTEASYP